MEPRPRRCHETPGTATRQPSSGTGSPAPFGPRYPERFRVSFPEVVREHNRRTRPRYLIIERSTSSIGTCRIGRRHGTTVGETGRENQRFPQRVQDAFGDLDPVRVLPCRLRAAHNRAGSRTDGSNRLRVAARLNISPCPDSASTDGKQPLHPREFDEPERQRVYFFLPCSLAIGGECEPSAKSIAEPGPACRN
jgi:hypothetical protein